MMTEIFHVLRTATLTLSVSELCVLLLILVVCLLKGFSRVGLLAAYLFLYRWVWPFFAGQDPRYLIAYAITGAVVGIIGILGMMRQRSESLE